MVGQRGVEGRVFATYLVVVDDGNTIRRKTCQPVEQIPQRLCDSLSLANSTYRVSLSDMTAVVESLRSSYM
jgi:hypothetical protein